MTANASGTKLDWYRIPIGRENLSALNKRSDFKGFVQTLGYLGILAVTGVAAFLAVGRLPWYVVAVLLFLHGTGWNFLINGFHELIHDSVFKTRWLNGFFLRIFSFLGWYSHVEFWASHTEHHKFTLHPPDDLEVVLPRPHTVWEFLLHSIFDVRLLYNTIRLHILWSMGKVEGQWDHQLFDDQPEMRRKLANWSRIVLLGHGAIIAVSCYFHWWAVPLVISLPSFYGGALHYILNNTQHTGLRDNVPDFRLCCRTLYLNPILQFVYWHMNYHTEHHMYAAIPCYNLPKLHRLIKADMPPCPNGIIPTWLQIFEICRRQKYDRSYLFTAPVPPKRTGSTAAVVA